MRRSEVRHAHNLRTSYILNKKIHLFIFSKGVWLDRKFQIIKRIARWKVLWIWKLVTEQSIIDGGGV